MKSNEREGFVKSPRDQISRRIILSVALCAPLAACGNSRPENDELPVPLDQTDFQHAWRAARLNDFTFDSQVLHKLPKEMQGWTGKLLVKSAANNKIQLVIIQIAEHLAIMSNAYSRDDFRAYAGNYVEFNAVQLDNSLVWAPYERFEVAGIWSLVKVKLDSVTAPRLHPGPGL
jgi:hypothetical protein